MKTSKLLMPLGIVALTVFAHLAPVHAEALDDIAKRGVLRVAVPQDFAPFGIGRSEHATGGA